MTGIAPVLLAIWGATVVLLAVINVYASRMARDEESQIFLGDSFQQEKSEQAAIVAKVHKIEPIKRAVFWLVCAMTVVVVCYYILDIIKQFR